MTSARELKQNSVQFKVLVIRDSGIQHGNDELQKLATTLFIARSKAA
jgi:hypothetical protein